jgi:hypothetical protein
MNLQWKGLNLQTLAISSQIAWLKLHPPSSQTTSNKIQATWQTLSALHQSG